jgi:hypothetical protein
MFIYIILNTERQTDRPSFLPAQLGCCLKFHPSAAPEESLFVTATKAYSAIQFSFIPFASYRELSYLP